MSIGVQSFPELYTTLIGWNLYDQLWELLSKTGLAFLPFIGIVLRNIAKPYESQETKDATSTSLRRMEIDIVATLLLIFLGVSPFIPLEVSKISYTPTCQSDSGNKTYHPGDSGTTWDKAFMIPSADIRVPVWWYAVMSVSEGFASSANEMVGCPDDLRKMVTEVDMTQINDPALRKEVDDFKSECYMPARTAYFADEKNNASTLQAIERDRKLYGEDDTDWFGSYGFQDAYYNTIHASSSVKGFSYTPANDINADSNKTNPPVYGMPTCGQWWNDNQSGLKNRLYAALPKSFMDDFKKYVSNDQSKDDVIKTIIKKNFSSGYQYADSVTQSNGMGLVTSLGIWFEQLSTYPKIYAASESAPIIQAILLLMIYCFLPFALIFSGYKPSTFVSGAIIIFSIIFWSFIWHLVSYVDSTLMDALYGKDDLFRTLSPNQILVDMIIGILIVVAPLFWFAFMGSMGIAVGNIVSNAFSDMGTVGSSAAVKGGSTVKSVANAAIK